MYCLRPIEVRIKTKSGLYTGKTRIVPCGKCPNCLKNYQHQWIVRLKEQLKASEAAYFVTLTYSDNPVNSFDKKECHMFLDRLRQRCKYKKATLKYFLISEYGSRTGRAHHHALLFLDKYLDGFSVLVLKSWRKGFVQVGSCTAASIAYCTKYVLKDYPNDLDWSQYPEKYNPDRCRLISQGLGRAFLSDAMVKYYKDVNALYYVDDGVMSQMPRYYYDKIFSEEELKAVKLCNRRYAQNRQILENKRLGLSVCKDKDGHYVRDPRSHRLLFYFADDWDDQKLSSYYRMCENKIKERVEQWKKRKKNKIV